MSWNPFRRPGRSRRLPSRKRKPYRLRIEQLERRTLFAAIQFGSAAYPVQENAGVAVLDVQLVNGPASQTVTVAYQTSDGTAQSGTDYLAQGGTLQFPPGATVETITVPLLDDGRAGEANESLSVAPSNPTNATLGSPASAVVTLAEGAAESGLAATEGQSFQAVVGNLAVAPASGKVVITWGDGTTSNGTPTANAGGGYDVGGSHTYAERGAYPVAVTDHSGRALGLGNHVTVADAALTAQPSSFTATEGQPPTQPVATFTHGRGYAPTTDFTATIAWGDGATSVGRVQASTTSGTYQVFGDHAYAEAGSCGASASVRAVDGAATVVNSAASVSEAGFARSSLTITAQPGVPFAGTVAAFWDVNALSTSADLQASIDWGDGTTSRGQVHEYGSGYYGYYQISGTHTYANPGSDTAQVHLTDGPGPTVTATTSVSVTPLSPLAPWWYPTGSVTVPGGGPIQVTAVSSLSVTESVPWTGRLASFTARAGLSVSDFLAQVYWAFGSSGPGSATVVPNGGRGFSVQAGYTYTSAGPQTIFVLVSDRRGDIGEAVVGANVLDAPLSGTPLSFHVTEGQSTSSVLLVASFTDPQVTPTRHCLTNGFCLH
jgi:hypothetical protein